MSIAVHGALLLLASLLLVQFVQEEEPVSFIPQGTSLKAEDATRTLEKSKKSARERQRDRLERERIVSTTGGLIKLVVDQPLPAAELPEMDDFPAGSGNAFGQSMGAGMESGIIGSTLGSGNPSGRPLVMPPGAAGALQHGGTPAKAAREWR